MKALMRNAAIVLAACSAVVAQSPLGTITGTVTDTQDARVPGVEITARNVGTNLSYRGFTSGDGTYVIPNLPVGRYEVTASAPGFKSAVRSGLTLEVAQRLRVDIQLEVGAIAETITVSGEVPRVQTEDSSLGTVIERERIAQLPMNGRHVFSLVMLAAGVQPRFRDQQGFAEITNQNFSQIRFNGGPVYGNQFFLDGGTNTVPVHNEISVVPMVDAVEEFKVETNSMKAEFGQTSGGVVNVVTKSGTNELHGSLYEFFRNDALDARNAFATQVDPNTGKIKPVLRYNQYGGTAGGPILLPKVYDGRNKSFFFFGYEQWRHRGAAVRLSTVPTSLHRAGNFTQTRDGQGNLIPIFDPATTRPNPAGSGWVRDPFPGNIIPSNRFDPVSLRVLEFMPQANATPINEFTQQLNFISLASSPTNQGVLNMRLDHRLSETDSMFFRYSRTRNTRVGRGIGLGVADPDTFARNDQRDNHNVIFTETHVFSPNIVNEFKGNFTRQNLPFQHGSFEQGWPQQLGLPSLIPPTLFPRFDISGMLSLGAPQFAAGKRAQHTTQIANSITIIKGRHQIKAGIDQRWQRLNWVLRAFPSGQYTFTAGLTNDPLVPANTGFGFATFLLGEVSGGQLEIRPFFSFHHWSHGSYFQDDFKVTPRLTLNYGLRWDFASQPVERHNRYSNFFPFDTNPETQMLGRMAYANVEIPRHFVDRDYNNWGPRFGFAYDLTGDGKTAVRGAYGLIYLLTESGNMQGDNSNSLGFAANTPFVPDTLGPFRAFRLQDGPRQLVMPLGPAGGPTAFRGQNVNWQDRNAPTPYLQQWNFTLQRQLPAQWVVSVSYAGNRGVKLFGANYNLNQLDPAFWELGLSLQDQVPNPFFGQIATGGLSGRTTSRQQLLRPYPDYLNVSTFANHGSSSTYHSLQVTVERRFSRGLSMLLSYTNGKLINDSFSSAGSAGSPGDFRFGRFNRRLERSLDQDDVSQRLVVSGVWELPFGKGKTWLTNAGGLVNGILGGWQINGINTIQTGMPLIVRGANNFTGINYPDLVRNPTLPRSERSVLRWFDTSAFANPPDWVVGNAPRTLPSTRGPGLVDLSLSVFKTFTIQERFRLETRVESFNALNWVNYNDPNTSFSPNRAGVNTNPNFGRITSALEARRFQLGLRLTF
jgi:hypothetical protein